MKYKSGIIFNLILMFIFLFMISCGTESQSPTTAIMDTPNIDDTGGGDDNGGGDDDDNGGGADINDSDIELTPLTFNIQFEASFDTDSATGFSNPIGFSNPVEYNNILYFLNNNININFDDDNSFSITFTGTNIYTYSDDRDDKLRVLASNINVPVKNIKSFDFIVFDNKFWIFGGLVFDNIVEFDIFFNDIWSSIDGINWVNEGTATWNPRAAYSSYIFDNKLWIVGGVGNDNDGNVVLLNEVWNTTNGIDWVKVNTNNIFTPRYFMNASVFNNKLWVFGGYSESDSSLDREYNYSSEVWNSINGIDWIRIADPSWITSATPNRFIIFSSYDDILIGIEPIRSSDFTGDSQLWYTNNPESDWLSFNLEGENLDFFLSQLLQIDNAGILYQTIYFNNKIYFLGNNSYSLIKKNIE